MAFSLNKVMLIGNLGKEAEHTFTSSNVSVSKFSIATQHSYKGKDGNWIEDTQWHSIVAFSLSDFIKDKLKKGAKIYVEGRIQTRTWDDNGTKKYFTEIVSEKIIPLDGKGSADNNFSIPNQDGPANNNPNTDDNLPF